MAQEKNSTTTSFKTEMDEVSCSAINDKHVGVKFPHSPVLHYASIYGALLFSV